MTETRSCFAVICDACGQCYGWGDADESHFKSKEAAEETVSRCDWQLAPDGKWTCDECIARPRVAALSEEERP